MKHFVLLGIAASLLCACASRQQVAVEEKPVVRLGRHDVARVRTGEYVERYEVGRYVDPCNRDIMHEGHPVYRLAKASRWDLRPNTRPLAPGGPVLGYNAPTVRPLSASTELKAELSRQRQLSAEIESAHREVLGAKDSLHQKMVKIKTDTVRVAELERRLEEERAARLDAESRASRLQTELEHQENADVDLQKWGNGVTANEK